MWKESIWWKKKGVMAALFLWIVLILGIGGVTYAAEPEIQKVRVGFFAMDGYHMIDENGIRSGYGYDFLQMVTRYVNFSYEYIGYDQSWENMQEMLRNGEIDMVSSVRKTEEREAYFDFSNPIGTNSVVLSVALNDERYQSSDYNSYNGMVIGLLNGNSRNADVENFAKEKGFRYTGKYYDTSEELEEALRKREVDAIATSSLRKADGEKTLDKFATEDFYVAVRKGNKELLQEINYAISQMDSVEGDWRNTLYYKYYGADVKLSAVFTKREMELIKEYSEGGKVLLAASNCDMEPYSYVEDGKLKGILPDIFGKYMEMCGISYEFYAPGSREEYQELVTSGKVPVLLDTRTGASFTEDHGRYISPAYITLNTARVTRKKFTGKIQTIAVTANQGLLQMEGEVPENVKVVECSDHRSTIQAVAEGRADAAYVYSHTAAKYVNEDLSGQLAYTILETPSYDYSISVLGDADHEILGIITKCIYALPKSEIADIIAKYTSFAPEKITMLDYMKANPWQGMAVVTLIVLMVIVALAIVSRERAGRRLFEEEQKSIKRLQGQMNIISALGCEYSQMCLVDLDHDTFRFLRTKPGGGTQEEEDESISYTEAMGNYIAEYVLPEQREQLKKKIDLKKLKERLSGQEVFVVNYQRFYGGTVSSYQMSCARVPSDDGIHRMVVGYRNVDDVVRHEREQQKALQDALDQARQASKAKTTFLSSMSHDMRTPMNAIIGFTTVALHRIQQTEQVKNALEKVLAAGNHLLYLINDILDMSRIESGRMQLHEQECSLAEIVHNLVNMNQAQSRAKHLEFYADTFAVKDERVYTDSLKLNQVLINVMSNAIKYTPSGGKVSLRIIQHSGSPGAYGKYEFIIKDNGMGMSKEFLEHIFDSFTREESATRTGIEGTGLGMAITRAIVDLMGGTITANSEKGKGSEFRIVLNLKVLEEEKIDEFAEKMKNRKALVTDDDTHTCEKIAEMLEEIGLECEWTTSGREAVDRIQRAHGAGKPFQICFVNEETQGQNGIETVRQIKEALGKEAPPIIFTTCDWSCVEEEARKAGVTTFCEKPLFRSDLREVWRRVDTPAQAEEKTEDWLHKEFLGKRILLAEDNELNREIAVEILEEAGFVVEAVPDGSDAVRRMAQAEKGFYDLILMDIQMPIMDGYEAAKRIREMEREDAEQIPIFAMSANALEEDRRMTLASGMNEHIAKPFDVMKFLNLLSRYV